MTALNQTIARVTDRIIARREGTRANGMLELHSLTPILSILQGRGQAVALVAAGGVAALKSIAAPLPQITFCPTGGVNAGNAKTYLALSNVITVGGSWVAPGALVSGQKWDEIEALARMASTLG